MTARRKWVDLFGADPDYDGSVTRAATEKARRDEWGDLYDRTYEFLIDLSEATLDAEAAHLMAGSIAQRVRAAMERK